MSVEENVETTRRVVKAWETFDFGALEKYFAEDLEFHSPMLPFLEPGRINYFNWLREWAEVYPDGLNLKILSIIGQDDLVGFEFRQEPKGPRHGSLFGGKAAQNEKDVLFVHDLFQFRDGEVVCFRGYLDYSQSTGEVSPMLGGHTDPRSFFYVP